MPNKKADSRYVTSLLTLAKQKYSKLIIDPNNPTRKQKVRVAVKMHRDGNSHQAIEIMVGRPIDINDPLKLTLTSLEMNKNKTSKVLRVFYEAFQET